MRLYDDVVKDLAGIGLDALAVSFFKSFQPYVRTDSSGRLYVSHLQQADLPQLAWVQKLKALAASGYIHDPMLSALSKQTVIKLDQVVTVALKVYDAIQQCGPSALTDIKHNYYVPYINEQGYFDLEPSGVGMVKSRDGMSYWHASLLLNNLALGLEPSVLWTDCDEIRLAVPDIARLMAVTASEVIFPEAFNRFMFDVGAIMTTTTDAYDFVCHPTFADRIRKKKLRTGDVLLAQYVRSGESLLPYFQIVFNERSRLLDLAGDNLMRILAGYAEFKKIQHQGHQLFYLFGQGPERDQAQMLALVMMGLQDDVIHAHVGQLFLDKSGWESCNLRGHLEAIRTQLFLHLKQLAQYQYLELSPQQLGQLLEAVICCQAIRHQAKTMRDMDATQGLLDDISLRLRSVLVESAIDVMDMVENELETTGHEVVSTHRLPYAVMMKDEEVMGGQDDLSWLMHEDLSALPSSGLFSSRVSLPVVDSPHSPHSLSDADSDPDSEHQSPKLALSIY